MLSQTPSEAQQSIGVLNQSNACAAGTMVALVKGTWNSISSSNNGKPSWKPGAGMTLTLCFVSQRLCCFRELYFWNQREDDATKSS